MPMRAEEDKLLAEIHSEENVGDEEVMSGHKSAVGEKSYEM